MRKVLLTALLVGVTALFTSACSVDKGEQKTEVQVAPVLAPSKAAVVSAKHVGAAGPQMPILEISGNFPGEGYTAQVNEERNAKNITLKVLAVPGPDAEKTGDTPFSHRHTLKDLGAGTWNVKVVDHRGVDIFLQEYTY